MSVKMLFFVHLMYVHGSSYCATVNAKEYNDHNNFISRLPDSRFIHNLALIGTHFSAAGENKFFQHTQNLTILQQLEAGIRVLDMDLRVINNELKMYYGPVPLNVRFDQVLTEVHKFLTENSGELVIMLMRTEYDNHNYDSPSDSKQCKILDKYIQLSKKRGLSLIENWSLLDDTIGEHRGHVLLGQFDGNHFMDCTTFLPCEVQNDWEFSRPENLEIKWKSIKRNADNMMNPYYPYHSCWLNYLSSLDIRFFADKPDKLSQDPKYLQYKLNTVKEINERMTNYFFNQYYTLAMIMTDLPSQKLIDKIINSNFNIV